MDPYIFPFFKSVHMIVQIALEKHCLGLKCVSRSVGTPIFEYATVYGSRRNIYMFISLIHGDERTPPFTNSCFNREDFIADLSLEISR